LKIFQKYGILVKIMSMERDDFMHEKRVTVIKRTVFIVVMSIVLTALLFIAHEKNEGSNYAVQNYTVDMMLSEAQSQPEADSIEVPDEAYSVVRLTFGGECTPASMLGSRTYGTFNAMAEKEGTAYFFSRISGIFAEDDCTVLGCAAVLSDSEELSPAEKSYGEEIAWYLAPAKNAEVFSSSSVELLSLANSRVMDYGEAGFESTKEALTSRGLDWSSTDKAAYIERAGIRIGILCTSVSDGGYYESLVSWAKTASESCDFVVIYADRKESAGTFYTDMAKELIDAGCSLVCYSGYADKISCTAYNNGMIVDSLGYLIDGGERFSSKETALYQIIMTVHKGKITSVKSELTPVRIYEDDWSPGVVPPSGHDDIDNTDVPE